MTNGLMNGKGEVVVRMNATYLKLFYAIAAGVISTALLVGGFIMRMEVHAAKMDSDVMSILEKIKTGQDTTNKLAADINDVNARMWTLQGEIGGRDVAAATERRKIREKLNEVKAAVQGKVPETKK